LPVSPDGHECHSRPTAVIPWWASVDRKEPIADLYANRADFRYVAKGNLPGWALNARLADSRVALMNRLAAPGTAKIKHVA